MVFFSSLETDPINYSMQRSNRRRLPPLSCFYLCLLLFLVCTGITIAAGFGMKFEVPERVEIILSTGAVDLGPPLTLKPGYLYYERSSALRVDFRCNQPDEWEIRLCGEDFRSGGNLIPITRLQWKTGGGIYQPMPRRGEYAVLASWRDYPPKSAGWHHKDISYRLELAGDECEGTYSSVITYSFFLP